MKTAVSIPDPVFEQAERLAKARKMSRSELYSRALLAYVEQHSDDSVTEALNRFYGQHHLKRDPGGSAATFTTYGTVGGMSEARRVLVDRPWRAARFGTGLQASRSNRLDQSI